MNTKSIELSNTNELHDNRRHQRHTVRVGVTLHAHGKPQSAVVTDLSVGGAGLNGAIGIFVGDAVEIELSNGRRIAGKVVWWISGCCGVEFDQLLADQDPVFAGAL